jgi:hypothetical protein
VSREDASEMERLGLLTVTKRKGKASIAKDDAWILEVWGELRRVGFSRALGFTPKDILFFADALSAMFQRETSMLRDRLSTLAPEKVAPMLERAIPIINTFLARYHESLVRSFFASIQSPT